MILMAIESKRCQIYDPTEPVVQIARVFTLIRKTRTLMQEANMSSIIEVSDKDLTDHPWEKP